MSRFLRALAAGLVLGSLIGAVGSGCQRDPKDETPDPALDTVPLEVAAEGYATSDACRSCHPSQYASWHASYHRTMTQPATPENVFGNFDDASAQAEGHTFRLTRRGDEFFATIPDPAWRGDGPLQYEERRIALVTGRHHLQIYWYETGVTRVLGYLPVAWDQMDQRWFPSDANFIKPPEDESQPAALEVGTWNYGCIACHVTDERPQWLGPPHAKTEASEFGIACEACHGPSQQHAAQMRNPTDRYAQYLADATPGDIVNPAKLDAATESQVCGRCHSVWSHASNEDYQRFLKEGSSFQPGEQLNEQGVAVLTQHAVDPGSFWPDDEVKPSGREYNGLIASPCYAGGNFGCSSCHALHIGGDASAREAWRDDQLRPGMRGNAACLQCHESYEAPEALAAHTHHPVASSGSECQNCHMPYTNLGLRKAIRSHTISSPDAEVDRATGRPNACNGCHLDQPLGWTARTLADWYGQPMPEGLSPVELGVPATIDDLLSGDAAQRAIAASALGWPQAVNVSKARQWGPPLLATLLTDPYDAIRYHAKRSLHRMPGFSEREVEYDWIAPHEQRLTQAQAIASRWAAQRRARGKPTHLGYLLTPAEAGGADLTDEIYKQLAAARDDRPIEVRE